MSGGVVTDGSAQHDHRVARGRVAADRIDVDTATRDVPALTPSHRLPETTSAADALARAMLTRTAT
jgi:hypothetical protein